MQKKKSFFFSKKTQCFFFELHHYLRSIILAGVEGLLLGLLL